MRTILRAAVLTAGLIGAASAQADTLVGSGASFPFPIYSAWFKDFSSNNDMGVRVDYQSKGSGAGINDLINKVVDFAGSDAAMTDEEIAKVEGGVVLLPMTAGEIVIAYNLKGVDQLKLSREAYCQIFLGNVEKWNDPIVAKTNAGVKLPDTKITTVVRSDSSGTTFNFTNHLADICPDFKAGPGAGKSVQWPGVPNIVKAPKNDGVTATIKQTPGAIGYIEYGYAKLTKTPTAMLENKAGNFVEAGSEAGAAALASASGDFDGYMRAFVTDPSGDQSYPMATFTWMLFYKQYDSKEKVEAIKAMLEYCLTKGQDAADKYGYIPLPEAVITKVRAEAEKIGAAGM